MSGWPLRHECPDSEDSGIRALSETYGTYCMCKSRKMHRFQTKVLYTHSGRRGARKLLGAGQIMAPKCYISRAWARWLERLREDSPIDSQSFPQTVNAKTGRINSPVKQGGEVGEMPPDRLVGCYSSGFVSSWAMFSNRVERFRKASRILPMGPLRCLAMMISARPSSSGSSGL
jgi:hypothetical protein